MKFLSNIKVSAKLWSGFGIICLILAAVVLVTISKVGESSLLTDRVIELRAPTAKLGVELQNGLNASLANLRGYMLLGKGKFETGRNANWRETIDPALARMTELSKSWTVEANRKKLADMKLNFDRLHRGQDEIASISGTVDNLPATKILVEQAAPQAAIMAKEITAMIDEEKTLKATGARKALLATMADVRGSLGLGLANIRAYLLTGEVQFVKGFDTLWRKNATRFKDLQGSRSLLTSTQSASFRRFSAARKIFDPLPPEMFGIRGGEEWNIANRWLGTKAAPVAVAINSTLDGMIRNQQGLMDGDADVARTSISALKSLLWILLAVGIAFSVVIASAVTRSIARPINLVTESALRFSKGDLNLNLDIDQKDEVGQLASAFREMGGALSAKAEAAGQIANGNLAVEVEVASQEDTLGNAMVSMVDSLKAMNSEVATLVEAAVAGNLDARGDTTKFQGDYAKLVQGINETLEEVLGPVNEASAVLEKVAARDLTARVMGEYQGDHARIKEALNTATKNLDDGMSQVGVSSEQVVSAAGQISSGSQSLAEGRPSRLPLWKRSRVRWKRWRR